MKRRGTKGVREDRRSGMMPDPERLSAVSRSPLVRAGSRWLSFARGLSRGRGRSMAAADPLAFIEALYGGRFTSAEGGAFSLDKVYRTAGGGLFITETRLSLSVHPKFDLHLLNFMVARAGSRVYREAATQLPHAGAGGSGQQRGALHITNGVAAAPSLTVQTWNIFPSGAERVSPAFGYVTVRGQRAEQALVPESARQEFVNVLLNTYLPAAASREVLNVRTAGELSAASARGTGAQGETERRFAPAPGMTARRPAARTYAGPSSQSTPGGAFEVRREFRSVETVKEHATARDPRPSMLHVLPPESLLLSLSETSLTVLAGTAERTTHHPGELAAPSLQLLRTHAATSGTREVAAAIDAPRPRERAPLHGPSDTREVLSSLHKYIERVHSTVSGVTHSGNSTFFTRPGFDATLRRGFGQVSAAQQRGVSSSASPGHITSPGLFGRSMEFAHLASVTEFTREASTYDAGAQTAPDIFSTQGVPGAGTFLFASGLLRRTARASTAGAPPPTAAESERAMRETRSARPEGMALELIRHRREEVLQLPSPGYVFTQPQRAQLEERQVITKASREEIVEVVRKEVRSLAASAPAGPAAPRTDFAGLADEVYSTLVRRLLVEKERLGRF